MRNLRWAGALLLAGLVATGVAPGTFPGAPPPHPSLPEGALHPTDVGQIPNPPVRSVTRVALGPASSPGDRWVNWTGGVGPSPRTNASMVYDPALRGVLLFGGEGRSGGALADSWLFANGSWSNITSSVLGAPPARWSAALTFDTIRNAVVLFGGQNGTAFFGDTWTLNNSAWQPVLSAKSPTARISSMAYDPKSGNLILFGGRNRTLGPTPGPWRGDNDTWQLRVTGWTNISSTAGAGPNGTGTLVFDAADRYFVVLGGAAKKNHQWVFYKSVWHDSFAANAPPDPYPNGSVAYDGEAGFVAVFGERSVATGLPSLWAYRANLWTNLTTWADGATGSSPNPGYRLGDALADDPGAGGLLLFGGEGRPPPSALVTNDSWGLLAVPFQVTFNVSPPATDAGLSATLTDTLNETTGNGFVYTYRYSRLPVGCISANLSSMGCGGLMAGSFTFNTSVVRSDGVTVNASGRITVSPDPTVQIRAPVTAGDPRQSFGFGAAPSNGTGPFVDSWQFGDGVLGRGVNVTHAYAAPGMYTVNLSALDAVGRTATSSVQITVHPGLGVGVGANRSGTDAGLPVLFFASPTNGTPPYTVSWSFSGGSGANGTTAVRSFATPGSYRVNATATDADGAQAVGSMTIPIAPLPTTRALASSNISDAGASVSFRANLTGGTAPFSYAWRFSDGTSAVGSVAAHAFIIAGPAWATVTVVDGAGAFAASTVDLTVHARPALTASVSPGGCGPPLALNVSAQVSGGTAPYTVVWSFGDATPPVNGVTAAHRFGDYGRFTVFANVTDAFNESASASLQYMPAPCVGTTGHPSGGGSGPAAETWILIAAAGIIGAVAVVLLLRRRRTTRRSAEADDEEPGPDPASTWSEDDPVGGPPGR